MPSPNDLILNPLTEDARRAYAPGRLYFESNMSARVDREVHASRLHLGTTMIYTHGLNRGGPWCFYPCRSAVIDEGDFKSLDIPRADIGIDCEIRSLGEYMSVR